MQYIPHTRAPTHTAILNTQLTVQACQTHRTCTHAGHVAEGTTCVHLLTRSAIWPRAPTLHLLDTARGTTHGCRSVLLKARNTVMYACLLHWQLALPE